MQTTVLCLNCNGENTLMSARCVHCSAPLPTSETLHVRDDELQQKLRYRSPSLPPLSPEIIALYLVGRSTPLVLESQEQLIFGRRAPGTRTRIVDLSPFHGSAMGVSREHACLHRRKDGYYLEDLESTNGTRVNDKLLKPHQLYKLTVGDRIQLGQMIFFLHFIEE